MLETMKATMAFLWGGMGGAFISINDLTDFAIAARSVGSRLLETPFQMKSSAVGP